VTTARSLDASAMIINGSGPTMYTAGVYAARDKRAPTLFESSGTPGGALMNMTKVEIFHDFRNDVTVPDFMGERRAQDMRFGAHLVEDGVAVGGGGDPAVKEGSFLKQFARPVAITHRHDASRDSKIIGDRAQRNDKSQSAWNSKVAEIHGGTKVEILSFRSTLTGTTSARDVSSLFVEIGHDPHSALVGGQVDRDAEGYVQVEGRAIRTHLGGVLACGDALDHTYRRVTAAAGSCCANALDAERYPAVLELSEFRELPIDEAGLLVMGRYSVLTEIADASIAEDVPFEELPVLVDFWEPWCEPCRALVMVLEDVAIANAARLKIVELNTEENARDAARYDAVSLPTLQLSRGGSVVCQLRGPTSESVRECEIGEALG